MCPYAALTKKIKMATAAIMNFYLVTLDHPRSLLDGPKLDLISFQSLYFPKYGHLQILQIWLKTPIPAPQNLRFLECFDP